MKPVIVVDSLRDWGLAVPGVEVVRARDYLTEPAWSDARHTRVFNLSGDYRYQGVGYYVSLVAEARGHRPEPSVGTIQDFKLRGVAKVVSDDLENLIQTSLGPIAKDEFVLSVYFGRNLAKRHDRLARELFRAFPAPLLQAHFERDERWDLRRVALLDPADVPRSHREFVLEAATAYFARNERQRKPDTSRFDLAIFVDPEDATPPSNDTAIKRFVRAGERLGFDVDVIAPEDTQRIAEYDALFIRSTTNVHHKTYRLARKAQAEGLVVIDDPTSILRCSNKVYLTELLQRHDIPAPKSMVVHRLNRDQVASVVGLPCVLKQPDGAYSKGVLKAKTTAELNDILDRLFEDSELVIAQEFAPTDFDWRVGVIDGKPLYVCKYFMARNHWQVIKHAGDKMVGGRSEALRLEDAPRRVLQTALKAAARIGDGLYGVDLKTLNRGRVVVVEVNDNPSIDAGYEDEFYGDAVYTRIMQSFLTRVERRARGQQ